MRTVVCDNAANAVSGYVSYMKRFGLDRNRLISSKNSMLNNLKAFINRELFAKSDLNPEWRTFSWRDGYTPMTWYFKLYLHPQQQIVAIISFYGQEDESKVRENRRVVRITEAKIRKIVEESVKGILKEVALGKDSYQAKPKNGGRLNDWEIMNILTTLVSSMIADKRVSKEDGEMLLHYALYNNDCYSHVDS